MEANARATNAQTDGEREYGEITQNWKLLQINALVLKLNARLID
jgi:hypothetical protein